MTYVIQNWPWFSASFFLIIGLWIGGFVGLLAAGMCWTSEKGGEQ